MNQSHEQDKQHAFDAFCKKVLKHEARDYYDEVKRRRARVKHLPILLIAKIISHCPFYGCNFS